MSNQYTAANDNPEGRPPEFDARIMQYKRGLEALARKLTRNAEEREDLVTDTIIYCLRNWRGYREDGGFYNWMYWSMRGVLSLRRDATRRRLAIVDDPEGRLMAMRGTLPTQMDHVELTQTLAAMSERGGDVVIRRAMGETLPVIAADLGVTAERVRQIEEKELTALRRKTKREAA
ncbi:RNA polymerase sigma factor (sigma-70 family) [Rhizobium leguminosarum]|uniref:sigma-70 family RNA polymerase sigma factor n=1 Tax=Rhizobium leguminosarum TaxID=384 RepID=UPI00160722F4|nr:sigma-70 family RNA polymerase sigma factor [Rhizobium leguminosarum]MBB5664772.1 RNA polymerase sigma factor (sigma-70 family) [Rhizobium leguminosarum]